MLYRVIPAGFEDVVEADEVGQDVGIGVCDAVADTGLGCEVHNHVEVVVFEEFIDSLFRGDIAFDEVPVDGWCLMAEG